VPATSMSSMTSPSSESAVEGLLPAWSTETAEMAGMGVPISWKNAFRSLVRYPPPNSMIAMVWPVPSSLAPWTSVGKLYRSAKKVALTPLSPPGPPAAAVFWRAGRPVPGTRIPTEDSGDDTVQFLRYLDLAATAPVGAARVVVHADVRGKGLQQITNGTL